MNVLPIPEARVGCTKKTPGRVETEGVDSSSQHSANRQRCLSKGLKVGAGDCMIKPVGTEGVIASARALADVDGVLMGTEAGKRQWGLAVITPNRSTDLR